MASLALKIRRKYNNSVFDDLKKILFYSDTLIDIEFKGSSDLKNPAFLRQRN